MNDNIIKTLIALKEIKGFGDKSIIKALNKNPSVINVDELTFNDVCDIMHDAHISEKKVEKLTPQNWDAHIKKAHEILELSYKHKIECMSYFSLGYPKNLKDVPDAPILLFVKGNSEIIDSEIYKHVATIGTREPLPWTEKLTRRLIDILIDSDFITVSGLALGTDSICHQETLIHDGKTIAVLANGLDSVYPTSNQKLADEILDKGGALVSTEIVGTKAAPYRLVTRDKWQAALCDGVIAMQAKLGSGTIHAMEAAQKYNRPLGVLDPSIYAVKDRPFLTGNSDFIARNNAQGLKDESTINSFIETMIKRNERMGETETIHGKLKRTEQTSLDI